jgi:hypothetical protein
MMTEGEITAAITRIRDEVDGMDPEALQTSADQTFARLAQAYRKASTEGREAIRSTLSRKDRPYFWSLAGRAAELALADSDAEHLEDALAGHCIEDFREDPRENIRVLALIWYAAVQLNVSPQELFARAAEQASPTARDHLLQFAGNYKPGKAESKKILASMEIEAVDEGGRIRFRSMPSPWQPGKAVRSKRRR